MIIIKTSSDKQGILEKICNIILEKKLAGCANIIPNCLSFFTWENKIQKNKENLLLIKTLKINEAKIYNIIKTFHNYTTPEIITININNVDGDYLKWLTEVTEKND